MTTSVFVILILSLIAFWTTLFLALYYYFKYRDAKVHDYRKELIKRYKEKGVIFTSTCIISLILFVAGLLIIK